MKNLKLICSALLTFLMLTHCTDNLTIEDTIYYIINNSSNKIELEIYISKNSPNEFGVKQFEKKVIINIGDTASYKNSGNSDYYCFFNVNPELYKCADSVVLKFNHSKYLSHFYNNPDTSSFGRNILSAGNFDPETGINGSPYYYYITDEDYELASPY